jgi:hypothetical protein
LTRCSRGYARVRPLMVKKVSEFFMIDTLMQRILPTTK